MAFSYPKSQSTRYSLLSSSKCKADLTITASKEGYLASFQCQGNTRSLSSILDEGIRTGFTYEARYSHEMCFFSGREGGHRKLGWPCIPGHHWQSWVRVRLFCSIESKHASHDSISSRICSRWFLEALFLVIFTYKSQVRQLLPVQKEHTNQRWRRGGD